MTVPKNLQKSVKILKEDRFHGANWITKQALQFFAKAAYKSTAKSTSDLLRDLRAYGSKLTTARRSMVSVGNCLVDAIRLIEVRCLKYGEIDTTRRIAEACIKNVIDYERFAFERSLQMASKLIHGRVSILTHSYSETVFRLLKRHRRNIRRIFVTESRPLYEGRRLASRLADAKMPTTLIVDAAVGHHLNEADLVIVGADTVTWRGDLINKIGTRMIAYASYLESVPFYSICTTSKILRERSGRAFDLEVGSGSEVIQLNHRSSLTVRNFRFDVTPSRLVTGIISEIGIVKTKDLSNGEWLKIRNRHLDAAEYPVPLKKLDNQK